MDSVYKALSDQNRRKILEILKQGDLTVTEIGRHFSISGATLSHHLEILRHVRLVVAEREGQHIRYSLNTSVFEETVRAILTIFERRAK